MEVAAHKSTDIGNGVVVILWHKHTTLWDYDSKVYDRMLRFFADCWPVRIVSCQICCPPWYYVRMVKPIIFAVSDKHIRSRFVIHSIPESQLLKALARYGILKDMLPVDMGGTIEFNQSEWIANRRCTELEEL